MAATAKLPGKLSGTLIEYLDRGKLRPGLVVRESADQLGVIDSSGHEKFIRRDLVLLSHTDRPVDPADLQAALAAMATEREKLAADLDLQLLWEVVHENNRGYSAIELAELFFGRRSSIASAVILDALLADRIYFTRRHMEFVARDADAVERLNLQASRERLKSDSSRRTRAVIRDILEDGPAPSAEDSAALVKELTAFLANPHTRKAEVETILANAMPEVSAAEIAYEVLERLGETPSVPRFALIGGFPRVFSKAALEEASAIAPSIRDRIEPDLFSVTIDDEETIEIDDALSCVVETDGSIHARIHIALCADFVPRGGAMDREAAARAATVYLPEATVRMLPDEISCIRASLLAGQERPVLTTDVHLGAEGELLSWKIQPGRINVGARLDYEVADRMLLEPDLGGPAGDVVRRLGVVATLLRERRRRAGAMLYNRREPKIRVHNGEIDVQTIDTSSPSRILVAELMVLSNYVAARYAADNRIPVIYRVQPNDGGDLMMQRAHLSLYPESHSGIGLDCYAQLSSPLRRYADLVLQRQLVAALTNSDVRLYDANELLEILANVENAEGEAKELERHARRYWTLRHLERTALELTLVAIATREGATAELTEYAIRGSLHGAPALPEQAPILVKIGRIDPIRGLLAMSYVSRRQDEDGR